MWYLISKITSCLPSIDDSAMRLAVCLTLGVAMVLWKPPDEIPVDSSVQPSTPTMHSSMMEKGVEVSDTWPDKTIFTWVPGDNESSAMTSSKMMVYGSTP